MAGKWKWYACLEGENDSAVKAEVEAITKWLKAHGMRQIANSIEKGEYK